MSKRDGTEPTTIRLSVRLTREQIALAKWMAKDEFGEDDWRSILSRRAEIDIGYELEQWSQAHKDGPSSGAVT